MSLRQCVTIGVGGIAAAFASLLVGQDRLPTPQWLAVSAADEGESKTAVSSDLLNSDEPASGKADDLLDLDLESLGSVKVQKAPAHTAAQGTSTVLDQASDDFSGSNTTGELLDKAASVNTRRTSALNLDASVRGYNARQIGATANGVNQLKSRVDIDSLFSQVDPGIVEWISVIDGPYSSLYGPGFAFINAELFQAPRNSTGGSLITTYGTNGEQFYARKNGWVGNETTGAYFSYGIRTGNDYTTGGDNSFDVPSSYKKWDVFTAVSHDFTENVRLDFNYLRTEINDLELPGIAYDLNNSHNDQFNLKYVLHEGRGEPERAVLQFWWSDTKYHGDSLNAAKQKSFYRDFMVLSTTNPADPSSAQTTTFGRGQSSSLGTRFYGNFGEADDLLLTLGGDWRRVKLLYDEHNFEADGDLAFAGNVYGIPKSWQDDFGLFSHLSQQWSDQTKSTLGGRIDFVKSQVDQSSEVISAANAGSNASITNYRPGLGEPNHFLGMLYSSTTHDLTDAIKITGGVAFAMRAPTPAELYQDEPYEPAYRFGNSFTDGLSDLAPERNIQLDLGIAADEGPLKFGARGFYSHISDYIMAVPSGTYPGVSPMFATNFLNRDFSAFDPSQRDDLVSGGVNADTTSVEYQYANLNRVDILGTDAFLEVDPERWLSLRGAVSYVHATNFDPLVFVPDPNTFDSRNGNFIKLNGSEPLPGIYPFNATLTARIFQPEDDLWSLAVVTRLVADQNRVARSVAERPTDGFAVFSLRGYVRPTPKWKLTMGIENFTDTKFRQHGSLAITGPDGRPTFVPEPGISYLFGSELSF